MLHLWSQREHIWTIFRFAICVTTLFNPVPFKTIVESNDSLFESWWTASTRESRQKTDNNDDNNNRKIGILYNRETDDNDGDNDKRSGGIQWHQENDNNAHNREEKTPLLKEGGRHSCRRRGRFHGLLVEVNIFY